MLVDMSVEELRSFQGRNPKPTDFDEYWSRALAELDAQPDELTLTKADFQAPNTVCYDLWFSGVGGARVYAKYVRPCVAGVHPAILKFHGYSGWSGDWSDLLSYANAGFSVFALDARGQGGLSEDRASVKGNTLHGHIIRGLEDDPDKLLFRNIFLDTAQLARIAASMPEVDENRMGCFGMSQGGALTLACASLYPGMKAAAPMAPFLCDYKRVWEMDLDVGAYSELKEYFRMFDPTHAREDEIFNKLGYIDLQYLAPRIQAKLQLHTGLMDTICPPSTQFAAYNKMTCDKEVILYPDYAHEIAKGSWDTVYSFMINNL